MFRRPVINIDDHNVKLNNEKIVEKLGSNIENKPIEYNTLIGGSLESLRKDKLYDSQKPYHSQKDDKISESQKIQHSLKDNKVFDTDVKITDSIKPSNNNNLSVKNYEDEKRFEFYEDEKFIGSFDIYQFIKYIIGNKSPIFLRDIDISSAKPVIEKYIGSMNENKLELKSYLDSKYLSNISCLVNLQKYLNYFEENRLNEELGKISDDTEVVNVFKTYLENMYSLFNHALIIISLLIDKYNSKNTLSIKENKIKQSLMKYSFDIITKLSYFVNRLVNINSITIDNLEDRVNEITEEHNDINNNISKIKNDIEKQSSEIDVITRNLMQPPTPPQQPQPQQPIQQPQNTERELINSIEIDDVLLGGDINDFSDSSIDESSISNSSSDIDNSDSSSYSSIDESDNETTDNALIIRNNNNINDDGSTLNDTGMISTNTTGNFSSLDELLDMHNISSNKYTSTSKKTSTKFEDS